MRTNPAGQLLTRSLLSRRKLGLGAIGTSLLASASATAAEGKRGAPLQWSFAPVPIPTTSPYHVSGPTAATPDAEPSTITNFNGLVGFAVISGMVTRTNLKTGEQQVLPFADTNMRFMTGTFVGTDGQNHQGTFALVWVEVFLPGPGEQLHELNPTQFPPVGLFWTVPVPASGVQVDLGSGTACLRAARIPIFDYQTRNNAFFAGGPPPVPGEISFEVVWSGATGITPINNPGAGFAGSFIQNAAQMEWTAKAGDFSFVSEPLETSSSSFAVIGQETNGSFLQTG